MELNTAKADNRKYGTPEKPGEEGSFSAEYYRACAMLLDTEPQTFEGYWNDDDLRWVATSMNERMEEARQRVCTHMTDWLYEHRGEVGQWPHSDSGICLACRDKDGVGGVVRAVFSYFGWDFSGSTEDGQFVRSATWTRAMQLPYGAPEPVMPDKPGASAKKGTGDLKGAVDPDGLGEFRAYYKTAQEKATQALKKVEQALADAKGRTDFSPAEEHEVKAAKEDLKAARKRRKLPFLYKFFLFLVLFTVPGYVFSAMGGMPEELHESMFEMLNSGQWQAYLIWLPWIFWQLPEFAVEFVAAMGGETVGWRYATLIILAVVEVVAALVAIEFLGETSVSKDIHNWWTDLVEKPRRVRRAKKRLREAKKEYRATTAAYRESARKSNEASARRKIKELERQVGALRAERLESVNMKRWHERFEAFKRGEEYREARWLDAEGEERRRREQEAYEAAVKEYEEACLVYESKKELCALWQKAWQRYLSKENVPADIV